MLKDPTSKRIIYLILGLWFVGQKKVLVECISDINLTFSEEYTSECTHFVIARKYIGSFLFEPYSGT